MLKDPSCGHIVVVQLSDQPSAVSRLPRPGAEPKLQMVVHVVPSHQTGSAKDPLNRTASQSSLPSSVHCLVTSRLATWLCSGIPRCGVGFHREVLLPESLCSGVPHTIACSGGPAAYRLGGLFHGAPPPQDRHGVGGGLTATTCWAHCLGSGRSGPEFRCAISPSAYVLGQPLIILDRLGLRAPVSHPCRSTVRMADPLLISDPLQSGVTLPRLSCRCSRDAELVGGPDTAPACAPRSKESPTRLATAADSPAEVWHGGTRP